MGRTMEEGPDPLLTRAPVPDEAVPDRWWLAYLVMYGLGVGSLLPWNALITPAEYFQLRLRPPFQSSFESILSVSFTSTSFVMVLLLQRLQHFLSLRVRIYGGLTLLLLSLGTLLVLAITPLLSERDDLLDTLENGATTQAIALFVCGALCGIGQAFMTVSTMSYAAIFRRPSYLQAVSGGQGVAGLSITIANAVLVMPGAVGECERGNHGSAVDPIDHAQAVVESAVVYFASSCFVLLACLVGFAAVERLPFTLARKRLEALETAGNDVEAEAEALRHERCCTCHVNSSNTAEPPPPPSLEPLRSLGSGAPASSTGGSVMDGFEPRALEGGKPVSTVQLVVQLWQLCLSMVLVYIVTIAIFPSLTVTIQAATGSCEWRALFVPLGFVIFNLGDTIGRNLPCVLTSANSILAMTLLRFLFAPLFMMCYTGSGGEAGALQLPTFGGTDAMPIVLMLVFSITNGWITTSIFIASQPAVPHHLRQRAAALVVCFLNTGIFFGASLSFVVKYLNCRPSDDNDQCNPFYSPAANVSS